jgi:hypothetical protein
MRRADIAAAAAAVALAAAMLLGAWRLEYWLDFAPGPGFFPRWVAAAGALVGLGLLVRALRRPDPSPIDWPDRAGRIRVIATAAVLAVLVPAVETAGFVTAAAAFMLVVLLAVERCRVVPSLLSTAVTVGLVYGVFGRWLGVPLPRGPLGF